MDKENEIEKLCKNEEIESMEGESTPLAVSPLEDAGQQLSRKRKAASPEDTSIKTIKLEPLEEDLSLSITDSDSDSEESSNGDLFDLLDEPLNLASKTLRKPIASTNERSAEPLRGVVNVPTHFNTSDASNCWFSNPNDSIETNELHKNDNSSASDLQTVLDKFVDELRAENNVAKELNNSSNNSDLDVETILADFDSTVNDQDQDEPLDLSKKPSTTETKEEVNATEVESESEHKEDEETSSTDSTDSTDSSSSDSEDSSSDDSNCLISSV